MTDHSHPSAAAPAAAGLHVLSYARGPAWQEGVPMAGQAIGAHLRYIQQAGARGRLVVAGPFADDAGGLALLRATSDGEAHDFVARDPAVASGVLVCEARCLLPVVGRDLLGAGEAERNESVVRRLFEAVEARDPAALAPYAGDVLIHEAESLPYGGDYVGEDGVRRHAAAYMAHWGALQEQAAERRLEPVFLSAGDQVAVAWRQRGRDVAGRRAFDMPAMSLYRLARGRIVDSRMFHFDAAAVCAFLARPPGCRPRLR